MTVLAHRTEHVKLPQGLDQVRTLAELFAWRVSQTPHAPAYLYFDALTHGWLPLSWLEMAGRIDKIRCAFEALQLPRAARVAILMPNGLDAVSLDQAALSLALTPVPMHALDNPSSIAYILGDSESSVLVVATQAQWRAIVDAGVKLPALRHIIIAEGVSEVELPQGDQAVVGWTSWLDTMQNAAPAQVHTAMPRPDDLAALVYTSGTTGKPKGVMLSHDNVLENVKAIYARVTPVPEDIFLSFLPLSHTFERTAGYYLPVAAGSCVAHTRSVALIAEDLKSVQPTILISVPRIYERIYAVLQAALNTSTWKRWLFNQAVAVGWRKFLRQQHLPQEDSVPVWLDTCTWPMLNRVIAKRLQAQLGGRLRAAVSGGAALSHPIARCFIGLGIPVLQGYGMTEASPVVAANALEDNDPASIGRPLPGVEVRIGENQELQVRGRNVMRGYWKRDTDTQAAFTADDWLRTGDQAVMDAGRIRILGRIKEIIVTSTGEKIAPADLEQAITADPTFEQAYAFGDNQPFIGCIVVLNRGVWQQLANSLHLDPDAESSLQALAARTAMLGRIKTLTQSFPYYAQPRVVVLTLEPWTTENALLTPTLKLKRKNMEVYFAAVIGHAYQK
ncbi:MAG: long-chain fatty acid--CoA ligase [Pseudomonadales bacterium]|nr:long-chain fatty acid--CoA ligase [Pseudomonadales bacterium]